MKSHASSLAMLTLLVAAVTGAQAAVGARVLLQEWSPTTPKQQPLRTLTDDPRILSDQVQKAWTLARPRICKAVVDGMVAVVSSKGQQLRDVKCLLDEAPAFSVSGGGANAIGATLAIGGYVEATTTVPGPTGSSLDPRFSLAVTGHMALAVSVQPRLDQTLRIDKLSFSLSNANIDSHNATGDIIKFVAEDLLNAFKGPNFKKLAEDKINSQSIDLAKLFNAELVPVNALLRGPSTAIRVSVWARPGMVIVALGPRTLTPPGGGTMSGALRWDAGKVLAPGGCNSFSIAATVQTGPAPLRDPNGYFEPADAPMQKVGSFQPVPTAAANECRYRMTGLAAGWPNEVVARSSIGASKAAGNSLYRVNYALSGDGWDGHTVVPQPSAERNYLVRGTASGEASANAAVTAKRHALSPADPVINPVAQALKGGTQVYTQTAPLKASTSVGALQAKPNAAAFGTTTAPPSALTPAQVPSALR